MGYPDFYIHCKLFCLLQILFIWSALIHPPEKFQKTIGIGVTQLTFIIERSIYINNANNIRACI